MNDLRRRCRSVGVHQHDTPWLRVYCAGERPTEPGIHQGNLLEPRLQSGHNIRALEERDREDARHTQPDPGLGVEQRCSVVVAAERGLAIFVRVSDIGEAFQ